MKQRKKISTEELINYVESLNVEDFINKSKDDVFHNYILDNKLTNIIIEDKTKTKKFLDNYICYHFNLEKKRIKMSDYYKIVYKQKNSETKEERIMRRKEYYFEIAEKNKISKLLFYSLIEERENGRRNSKEDNFLYKVFTDNVLVNMCKNLPNTVDKFNNSNFTSDNYINPQNKYLISNNTFNYYNTAFYFIIRAYIELYIEKNPYPMTDGFIREPVTINKDKIKQFILNNNFKNSKEVITVYMDKNDILTTEQITNNLNELKSYICKILKENL